MFPLDPSDSFTAKDSKKRQREDSSCIQDCNDSKESKLRDDIRRQEMALRSVLPPEYVKGKSSILDEIQGAVNYINQLEKNIQELKMQRDMLKNCSKSDTSSSNDRDFIRVNPCQNGVEILISSSLKEREFPLSKVLKELLESGLKVTNCDSTKANEKSLQRVQCKQVSDIRCIDPSLLQQRLAKLLNLS